MTAIEPLAPDRLCRQCEDHGLSFGSTAELESLAEIVGQDRAVEAMRFGIGMRHHGYNLFLVGPPGIGKQTVAEKYLRQRADTQTPALDWCHVNDFAQDTRPRALGLPAGWGSRLKTDMQRLVEDLRVAIPSAFETDEFRARAQEIEEELKERQAADIRAITEEAQKHGISLLRTPSGFAFAPTRNGEVFGPEEFAKLPQEERERTDAVVSGLQQDLQKVLEQVPGWRRENREKLKALNRKVTMFAVEHLMEQLRSDYAELTVVLEYLAAVQQDVIDNVDAFRRPDEAGGPATGGGAPPEALRRYSVNLLVDHADSTGAPVVYEDNPNFQNLIGRVEYLSHMGALLTDFTLIKPGALHRANGGYLVLDARKLLSHPYAWEGLKRALQAEKICVESLGQELSLISTASLAELCALLSALAEAPVRQSLAVTGSVNQLGQVQAIGGVDEKVEGFFDICAASGLTGEQGVLIPAANVKHLMLKQDVVEAARDGRFHVYPVERVNQALGVLTGLPAGERDAEDEFPEDSVNYRVDVRLGELAVIRQTFVEVVKEMSAHQSGSCG